MSDNDTRWGTAVRVLGLKGTTITEVADLEELFGSLGNVEIVEVAEAELEGPNAELAKMFLQEQVEEDPHIIAETAVDGPQMYCLRDVAKCVLTDVRIADTPQIRAHLLRVIREGDMHARQRILANVDVFQSDNAGEMYRDVLDTVLEVDPSNVHHLIRGRPLESIKPAIAYAIKAKVPNLGLISTVSSAVGAEGNALLLQSLIDIDSPLGEEFLPWLFGKTVDDGLRPLSLELIARLEKRGVRLASGYLAFYENGAAKRFDGWLDEGEASNEKGLERWVEGYLIMPSMAAEVLENWEPSEQFVPTLRERIQREVGLKEDDWERDKQARRDDPEEYYCDDRKALMEQNYYETLKAIAKKETGH